MATVDGVRDIGRIDVPLCEVVEAGRGEYQRPANLATRHTIMVCKSGYLRNGSAAVGTLCRR
jgi:hypothetical protein